MLSMLMGLCKELSPFKLMDEIFLLSFVLEHKCLFFEVQQYWVLIGFVDAPSGL
jgi:hypothetical protein